MVTCRSKLFHPAGQCFFSPTPCRLESLWHELIHSLVEGTVAEDDWGHQRPGIKGQADPTRDDL